MPIPAFEHTTTESAEKVTVRDETDEDRVLVRALLEEYRLSLEQKCVAGCFTSKDFLTGFSKKTVDEIISNLENISSVDFVIEKLPVMRKCLFCKMSLVTLTFLQLLKAFSHLIITFLIH